MSKVQGQCGHGPEWTPRGIYQGGGGRWALSGGQFHQSWQGANLNLHGLQTREFGSPAKLEKTETRQGQEPDVQGLLGQSAPDLEHKVLII